MQGKNMKKKGTATAIGKNRKKRAEERPLCLANDFEARFNKAKLKVLLTHALALIFILLIIYFALG